MWIVWCQHDFPHVVNQISRIICQSFCTKSGRKFAFKCCFDDWRGAACDDTGEHRPFPLRTSFRCRNKWRPGRVVNKWKTLIIREHNIRRARPRNQLHFGRFSGEFTENDDNRAARKRNSFCGWRTFHFHHVLLENRNLLWVEREWNLTWT